MYVRVLACCVPLGEPTRSSGLINCRGAVFWSVLVRTAALCSAHGPFRPGFALSVPAEKEILPFFVILIAFLGTR